jgi:spore germination protein
MRRHSHVVVGCVFIAGLLLSACAGSDAPSSAGTNPSAGLGFIVVTTGGTALSDGASDVPPTLDLRIRAGRSLSAGEAAVELDGRGLHLQETSGALTASVPAMPLASAHRLVLSLPGREPQTIAFGVVAPAAAHVALHRDPQSGAVLDIAFALAPERAAVERSLPAGGQPQWIDGRHLRLTWSHAPGGALNLPSTIATERGSHLAGTLHLSLADLPPAGALRSADVPGAGAQPQQPLVVAFSVGTVASRSSAQRHLGQISVLSPTGLRVNADGSVTGAPDASTTSASARSGVALAPVVQQFDSTTAATLVGDQAAIARAVAELRSRAQSGGWAGVNLDVENLPETARDGFSALVEALARGLHADGRTLAVDVVPHRPGRLNAASVGYDLGAIGRAADWVILMAYEEHSPTSAPGPGAGRDWQEGLLAGSLGEIGDPTRVLLGVPLYARTWPGDGSTSFADSHDATVSQALSVSGARVDYDFAAATPFISTPDGTLAYFDDAASLARKLALVPEHHLAGVAMWRLGFEDPALWAVLPASPARPA